MKSLPLKCIFSKIMSGLWPNFDRVAERVEACYNDAKSGKDIKAHQTSGTADKPVRRARSPNKNKSMVNPDSSIDRSFAANPPP